MVEGDGQLTLYDYWRSSACYRVRICLHLKGLGFKQFPVNLVHDGGEQQKGEYRSLNPQGLVPALVHGPRVLTQSMAICEYLEERFPQPPLLPADPYLKSIARAMAFSIACDIHPLNNLRVQHYLKDALGASGEQAVRWMNHWMEIGFEALEKQLAANPETGACCFGDEPGLVDCCLVPQVYNAERFNCDLSVFPTIGRIVDHCRTLPAFQAAAPARQPDAPSA
jgi:maleylacetoacetate isomerase